MQKIAEELNAKALTPNQLENIRLTSEPKLVVLRNRLRLLVGQRFVVDASARAGQRLIAYRCKDSYRSGHDKRNYPLTIALSETLDGLQSNVCEGMPTVQFFYVGIRLMFTQNNAHPCGYVKNNTCTGHRLILDTREPPDDGSGDMWKLRFPVLGMIVKPDMVDVGTEVMGTSFPPNCIPVVPKPVTFALSLPSAVALHPPTSTATGGKKSHTIKISRSGLPLDTADVFTDYWCEGMTFDPDGLFLLDLTPPEKPENVTMEGASIRVPLSRYRRYSDVKLFRPLWSDDKEKGRIINKLWKALQPNKVVFAERKRMLALEADTLLRYAPLMAKHGLSTAL